MHVFLTGGTGTIGSAVLPELLRARHTVTGLARSDASAAALSAAEADVVRGGLDDLDVLTDAARASDGVIHLAFGHDFAAFEDAIAEEGRVVTALGEALVGTGKALVIASGTPVVPGRMSTEDDPSAVDGPAGGRGRNAQAVLDLSARGVRSAVVRLPRTVHNQARGGFASMLVNQARTTGIAAYPAPGTQRWPAVHALDAAVLFRLALEQAEPGAVLHAVADEGDAVRDIVEVIGARLGLPVEQLAPESFGPLGPIFAIDQPSSSALTRERFGWQPTHPGQLSDLETFLSPASE